MEQHSIFYATSCKNSSYSQQKIAFYDDLYRVNINFMRNCQHRALIYVSLKKLQMQFF